VCSTVTRRRAQARLSATIRRGAGLPAWLAAGRGPEAAGVGVAEADGGAVAERAHPQRQAIAQPRGAQHGAVGGGAAHARGSVHDRAGRLVDRHLDLERVLLFLAAGVGIGLGAALRALHPLREGIHEDRQPRRVAQQGVQPRSVAPPRVGQAHGRLPRRFQQRHHPPDRPACGRLADAEAVAEHLSGGVAPQPDDRQQQVVARRQAERPPAADGPAAIGASQPGPRSGGVGWQYVRRQRVERADRQPGQHPEDGGVARQVVVARDQRGPPSAPSIPKRGLL